MTRAERFINEPIARFALVQDEQLPLVGPERKRDDVERDKRRSDELARRRRVDAPVDDETGSVVASPPAIPWVAPRPLTFADDELAQLHAGADRLELVYCAVPPLDDGRRCHRPAEGWFDGVPACVDCVDAWLERDAAFVLTPYSFEAPPDLHSRPASR